jgi:tetratricopeptide (TPR) repeat protein
VIGLLAFGLAGWILSGVRPVDPSWELAVVEGPLLRGGAARVRGRLALAPPGLFQLSRYPRWVVELPLPGAAEAMLPSEQGTRYGFRGSVAVEVRPEAWRALHAAAGHRGLRRAVVEAVKAAGGDLPPGPGAGLATPAVTRTLQARLNRELDRRGLALQRLTLDAVDVLMAAEGGPVARAAETRLLVVGWDGADWEILDPLLQQGRLPHLQHLIQEGVRAKLLSIEPTLSPVVWTSVATGVEPVRHGILDFLVEDPERGAAQPVTSAQRRVATVWEILSRAGVSVGVVGWWASWPAEPVRGYLVSDRIAYQLFGFRADPEDALGKTWPPQLYGELVRPRIQTPSSVGWQRVQRYLEGPRQTIEAFRDPEERKLLDEFKTLLASGETYLDVALALREHTKPDLEVVYFEGTDTVGHLFMPYRPPRLPGVDPERYAAFRHVVDRYYQTADEYLGRLLEGKDGTWTVIVLSDHGFVSDARRPRLTDSRIGHGAAADWHGRFGIVVLSGAKVARGRRLDEASVYDIAPTILALFGQPVPRSWAGHVLGPALDPAFLERHPVRYTTEEPRRGERVAGTDGEADPAARELLDKLRSLGYVGADPDAQAPITARNNTGVALMAEGKAQEAEAVFRAGLREHPGSLALTLNLGVALRLQGRDDEAVRHLEQAFRHTGTRRVAGHLLGQLRHEQGRLAEAKGYLREVLRGEPGAAEVRTTLGAVLEQEGKLEDAEREYLEAAELDPDSARPRNSLGSLARRRGQDDLAEQWFMKAIEADPYFMGAYNNLALVYQDRGAMDRAIDLYSRALIKAPANAVVLNNLASLYYVQGDLDEAETLWRRALRADPRYPSPLNNLAGLEIRRGNHTGAEGLLRRALELKPDYGDARLNLAVVHWARGERDAARTELERAAEDAQARPKALSQLGFLAFEMGQYDEAASALDQARGAGARGTDVLNVLGETYRLLDRRADAVEAWKASLALDPTQKELARQLAALQHGGRP